MSKTVWVKSKILGLVPSVAQQIMNFLSDSLSNMGQKEDTDDLTRDTCQPFQLVVPRKKKTKKQHSDTSKGFKMGVSSRSPY